MSGHSKWSTIKRQKQVTDAKRGQLFTKLSRAITLAVKESGGVTDETSNFKLRIAVEQAKSFNMPKENIKRAVERGAGSAGENDALEHAVYEGFGPGGVALLIEAVTDNKQRTSAQIKHVFDRFGGSLGNPGSVSYLFDQQGVIVAEAGGQGEEELLQVAIEAGATDMESGSEGTIEFYTSRERLHAVKEALEKNNIRVRESALIYRPKSTILTEEGTAGKLTTCIDQLAELEDVQEVYTNRAE